MRTVYKRLGGPGGSGLGFPVSPATGVSDGSYRQRFEHGLIVGPNPRRVYAVRDEIRKRWMGEADGPAGPWGYPVGHTEVAAEVGLWNGFQRVVAYWSDRTGVRWIGRGPIYRQYRLEGGSAGPLGFPVTDQTTAPGGLVRVRFQNGTITHDPQSGETTVDMDSS